MTALSLNHTLPDSLMAYGWPQPRGLCREEWPVAPASQNSASCQCSQRWLKDLKITNDKEVVDVPAYHDRL